MFRRKTKRQNENTVTSPINTNNHANTLNYPIKIKKSLMQRLSNWFEDHLPLRRSSRSVSRPQKCRQSECNKNNKRAQVVSSYSCTNNFKSTAPTTHRSTKIVALGAAGPRRNFDEELPKLAPKSTENSFGYFREDYVQHRKNFALKNEEDELLLITTSPYTPNKTNNNYRNEEENAQTLNATMGNFLSQSFMSTTNSSKRKKIRTNPWILRPEQLINIGNNRNCNSNISNKSKSSFERGQPMWSSFSCGQRNSSNNHNLMNRPAQWQSGKASAKRDSDIEWPIYATINRNGMDLLVPGSVSGQRLNESTCSSSGYGSQDSSPESSVHSPDWQPSQQIVPSNNASSNFENPLSQEGFKQQNNTCDNLNISLLRNKIRNSYNFNNNNNGALDEAQHIYHELECLQRLSMLLDEEVLSESAEKQSLDSAELSISISEEGNIQPYRITNPTPSPTHDEITPPASPIYAVPFEDYNRLSESSEGDQQRTSLSIMSPFFKQLKKQQLNDSRLGDYEVYSSDSSLSSSSTVSEESCSSWMPIAIRKRSGNFSTRNSLEDSEQISNSIVQNHRLSEFNFLAKLDQQIAELQIQSDAVRQLVDAAKERQEARFRTRQLCLQHLKELRQARQWVLHRNFELCL